MAGSAWLAGRPCVVGAPFTPVKDARQAGLAIRARPAVEVAVAERDRLLAGEDDEVLASRIELAERSKTMARYGTAGLQTIGESAPGLRRLARRVLIT